MYSLLRRTGYWPRNLIVGLTALFVQALRKASSNCVFIQPWTSTRHPCQRLHFLNSCKPRKINFELRLTASSEGLSCEHWSTVDNLEQLKNFHKQRKLEMVVLPCRSIHDVRGTNGYSELSSSCIVSGSSNRQSNVWEGTKNRKIRGRISACWICFAFRLMTLKP